MSKNLRYEIEETTNAVKIYYDEEVMPSLFQPTWPNGDLWSNYAEAESWANLYIASIEDETAPYAPNSRGEEGRAKETSDEIEEKILEAKREANLI